MLVQCAAMHLPSGVGLRLDTSHVAGSMRAQLAERIVTTACTCAHAGCSCERLEPDGHLGCLAQLSPKDAHIVNATSCRRP